MQVPIEFWGLLGFILGPIAKTLYDFLWVLLKNPDACFDKRYWITMAASMSITLIIGLTLAQGFLSTMPPGSAINIFLYGFSTGFALNHIVNAPVDYLRKKEEKTDESPK